MKFFQAITEFFKETAERLRKETPDYWKKVQRIFLVIGATCLAIYNLPEGTFPVPEWAAPWFQEFIETGAFIGFHTALIAQLAKDRAKDEKDSEKK